MTAKLKRLTEQFENKQLTIQQFRAKLTTLDVDASNLLQSFRTTKFTSSRFIKEYQMMVAQRNLN